jgi:hypothetical protein
MAVISFAVFDHQVHDVRKGVVEDLAPCIPVRLRAAARETPALEVIARDPDQRGVGAELLRDRPVERQTAPVEPPVSWERNTHGFMLSRGCIHTCVHAPRGYYSERDGSWRLA